MTAAAFDPEAKERELRAESIAWDTSCVAPAEPGDIPVVDIAAHLARDSEGTLRAAGALAEACETVGFFQLVGHDLAHDLIDKMFSETKRFHDLPVETKRTILMDRAGWPIGGAGYLPMLSLKLPSRGTGNLNEAFLVKGSEHIELEDNQWLADEVLPGFRETVESYTVEVNRLARALLPIYATALGLDPTHFDEGFRHPAWRLRMTHYPTDVAPSDIEKGDFGIPPHVDTTFFTLLLQDAVGLTIYSHVRRQWIEAPVIPHAFVVNSGELLKQWTNDRYLSVRHFANSAGVNSDGKESRYSIPFFYNAAADHPMECLPTCHGPGNPPKYPTISYAQSQAAAQGE